ncbi:RING finger protein [Pelomyxa schiedti]|nr:RING finger protein [Pelomyxa schiedti]
MPQCFCHGCNRYFSTNTTTTTVVQPPDHQDVTALRCLLCGSDFAEEVDPEDPPRPRPQPQPQPQPQRQQQEIVSFSVPPQSTSTFSGTGGSTNSTSFPNSFVLNSNTGGGGMTIQVGTLSPQPLQPQPQPGMPMPMPVPPPVHWGQTHFMVHTNMSGGLPFQFYQNLQNLFNVVAARHGLEPGMGIGPLGPLGPGGLPQMQPGATGLASDPRNYAWGNHLNELMQQMFDNSQGRSRPASASSISSLAVVKIQQHHVDDKEECTICKDDYKVDDEVTMLPCKHLFHPDCIKHWLNMHNTCPSCRHELPTDDPEYEAHRSHEKS